MNFISMFIYILISLAAGLGLIGISLDIEWISLKNYVDCLSLIIGDNFLARIMTLLSGILIILIFLRFIQKALIRSRKERTIRTETADGQISITLVAIEDMIKKNLGEEDIIANIKPKVASIKKAVIVSVKLALKTEVNIKDFAKEMQGKIKNKLQALLGKEKDLRINIEIKKITFSKKGALEEEPEEEYEGPFRNY